jgi:nucleoid-associated protein YgaU
MTSGAVALTTAGAAAPAGGSRPATAKATLEVYDPKPAQAGGAKPASLRSRIHFQFNPKELSIQKSARWERKPARNARKSSPAEFKGADPCKLSLEMFFDASDKQPGSVVEQVEELFRCCVPTDETRQNKKATPPLVQLNWGTLVSFPAFITSVQAKYTLFSRDGTPIRATCSISMEEMPGDPLGQNPTSGAQSAHAVHTVIAGDSLASVAYQEYGDPSLWRPLAAANNIDDPIRLPTGTTLLIPAAHELTTDG